MPGVRVYGYGTGESSFAQVTRGLMRALASLGEIAGFYPLDGDVEQIPESLQGGQSAPVALNCGHPDGLLRAHRAGSHAEHWLLLAPNSDGVPHGLVEGLLRKSEVLPNGMLTGGLLTPSSWAAGVLRRAFPSKRVIVAPHGINPEIHLPNPAAIEATRRDYAQGLFNVLHMSSTDADRKGTKLLMRAWKALKERSRIPKTSRLHILMNPTRVSKVKWWASDIGLSDQDYVVSPGFIHGQEQIAVLYNAMHVVCQPSRAEGFGMVPLEALCSGTPVVATSATGHAEYLSPGLSGFIDVPVGKNGPMDDYPGSSAPTVTVDAIERALAQSYASWARLSEGAVSASGYLRNDWTWEQKTGPAITAILKEKELRDGI